MTDLAQVAQYLVQQTQAGQRQFATATVLAAAEAPLDRAALIARVTEVVGPDCYGTRPEHIVWSDIQVLKRAGLPIRYTRAAPRPGYYVPNAAQQAARDAARLLRRIGWQLGDGAQVAVYARMAPARKVAQMLQMRGEQVRQLEARLRQEHPAAAPAAIRQLRQQHLALLQEDAPGE